MLWGVDSAYPSPNPSDLVAFGYSFACGYVGGRALHVWTADDWRTHAAAGLRLVPIWVSPTGTSSYDQGIQDGNGCLVAMQSVGLSGMCVADVESGAMPRDWYRGFTDALHAGQCASGLYGSSPTIQALGDLSDTWWLASWVASGQPLRPALPDWSMWQYATGPTFDYNVAVHDFTFAGIAL